MSSYGAKQSFSYNRFFRDGFAQWELEGIDNIMCDFVGEHTDALYNGYCENVVTPATDGDKKQILMSYIAAAPGNFYALVGFVYGYREKFRVFMRDRGMSFCTLYRRFHDEDWRPYERVGIRKIWEEFLNECQPTA